MEVPCMSIDLFSLFATATTLGNSCNLHKCKMAAMYSEFTSGWDIIQLIYLKSCVTPLYQIILSGKLIFGVNLMIGGHSIGKMSSSRSFSVKECSTKGRVYMLLTLKTNYPQQKHHNMNP